MFLVRASNTQNIFHFIMDVLAISLTLHCLFLFPIKTSTPENQRTEQRSVLFLLHNLDSDWAFTSCFDSTQGAKN